MASARRRYPPDEVGDALIAIYREAEERLVNLAAAALERNAQGTARYYSQQRDAIRRELRTIRRRSAEARGAVVRSAYLTGTAAIDRVVKKDRQFTGVHDAAMEVLAANLANRLATAEDRVGREVDDLFRRAALKEVAAGAATGATRVQTSQQLAAELRSQGLTAFTDRKGRKWKLDTYAAMVVRTTTREAMSRGMANRLIDHGRHLVTISEHANSCPICKPYEGKTFTLTEEGEPGHPRLDHLPPFHPNCRHVLTPAATPFEEMERALGLGPAEPDDEQADETQPDTRAGDPVQAEIERIRADVGKSTGHRELIEAGRRLDKLSEAEIRRRSKGIAEEIERNKAERLKGLRRRSELYEAGEFTEAVERELETLREEQGRSIAREIELEQQFAQIRSAVVAEILGRVRPMGGDLDVRSRRGKAAAMLSDAERLFPADWIDRANEKARGEGDPLARAIIHGTDEYPKLSLRSTRSRAFYSDGDREVKVRPGDLATLVHELGHYFEYHGTDELPNGVRKIRRVLQAFYDERTAGEELRLLSVLTGNSGYGRHEKAREDKFAKAYIGKDYGDDRDAMEVLTMGLEGLFFDRHEIREKDPEHLHLILGILGFVR